MSEQSDSDREPAGTSRVGGWWLPHVTCSLLMAYLVLHTAMGIGRSGSLPAGSLDYVYLYASGVAWLDGENPYVKGVARNQAEQHDLPKECCARLYCVAAYPPHSSTLVCSLSAFEWDVARRLFIALNLALSALIMWVVLRLVREHGGSIPPWLAALILPLSIGPFFADTEIHYGQVTLIVLAGLVIFVWCYQREWWWLAGVALAISAVKPNIVFIPCCLLLFRPRWRIVVAAVATVLVLSIPAMVARGGPGVFLEWFDGLRVYKSATENQAHGPKFFGLAVIATRAGLGFGMWAQIMLAGSACVLCGMLWRSGRFPLIWIVALAPLSLLLAGGHDLDLIMVGPVIALLGVQLFRRLGWPGFVGCSLFLCAGWMAVQPSWFRIDALFGHDLRVWREVFVIGVIAAYTYMVFRRREPSRTTAA